MLFRSRPATPLQQASDAGEWGFKSGRRTLLAGGGDVFKGTAGAVLREVLWWGSGRATVLPKECSLGRVPMLRVRQARMKASWSNFLLPMMHFILDLVFLKLCSIIAPLLMQIHR